MTELKSPRLLILMILLAAPVCVPAQHAYTAISIPTRVTDAGKRFLAADRYAADTTAPKPVILIQTPYNRKLYRLKMSVEEGGGGVPYDSAAYDYVIVDWRGFNESKDADITGYDRGLDGYDIVEWIAQQPWCNGKVGTWGGSALGQIQFMTARHQPPHLVCCAPFIKDYKTKYSDFYYGGVWRTEHNESLAKLGFSSGQALAHPTHDPFWNLLEQTGDHPEDFKVPMFLLSGWYDHYPGDIIRAFSDMQARSDPQVRDAHKLIMGPWSHSEIGVSRQGILDFPEAEGVPLNEGRRFLDHHLLGAQNGWDLEPAIRWFSMGDHYWEHASQWIPAAPLTRSLYLRRDHLLANMPEPPTVPPFDQPPDTVVADPRDPSPTIGGSRFNPFDRTIPVGPQDMAPVVEARSDVAIYTSPEFTGPEQLIDAHLELYVASDCKDADFSARLCDVWPDGRSILLTQGIRRLRFHDSYDQESLVPVGTIVPLTIDLDPTPNVFLPGHRLRVIMSGSNAPMFDVNLNNGGPMYTAGDTIVAHNLIHHTAGMPSRLVYRIGKIIDAVENAHQPVDMNVEVAPNPAREQIRISLYVPLPGPVKMELYDMSGRVRTVVMDRRVQAGDLTHSADISDLRAGVYYLRVVSAKSHCIKKLVVLR